MLSRFIRHHSSLRQKIRGIHRVPSERNKQLSETPPLIEGAALGAREGPSLQNLIQQVGFAHGFSLGTLIAGTYPNIKCSWGCCPRLCVYNYEGRFGSDRTLHNSQGPDFCPPYSQES